MANFITEFEKGQKGGNKGIAMGDGIINISSAINGLQRGRIYVIAAPPKAGKSTFTDYGFVLEPYLQALKANRLDDIEWIYYSFELDRISKEFDFAAYFLYVDFGISHIDLPEGVTKTINKQKLTKIPMSPDYLRGRILADSKELGKPGEIIKVSDEILEKLKTVYKTRIIPLFGEYTMKGEQLSKGKIIFIEEKNNPTGLYKELKDYAKQNGTFIKSKVNGSEKYERITGYTPNNPNKFTIVVTDHLRKLIPERGWKMKETVDKYSEYTVELRNWCQFTFAHIIHLNRSLSDEQRLKSARDMLYPTAEDIKDTGNLSEDADYVFTLFNPNDERYKLDKHFGTKIKDSNGNPYYPFLRTVHLVESRHCMYPQHFRVEMHGGTKTFKQINI